MKRILGIALILVLMCGMVFALPPIIKNKINIPNVFKHKTYYVAFNGMMDKEVLPNGIGLIWWNSQVCSFDGSNPDCGDEAVNLRIYNGNTNKYYPYPYKTHYSCGYDSINMCFVQVLENKTIDFDLLAWAFPKSYYWFINYHMKITAEKIDIDYDKLGDSSAHKAILKVEVW
ncbi:MAG: hypothetical protein AABW72_03525 [archaeon]